MKFQAVSFIQGIAACNFSGRLAHRDSCTIVWKGPLRHREAEHSASLYKAGKFK